MFHTVQGLPEDLALGLQADPLTVTAYRDTPLHQAITQSCVELVAEMLKGVAANTLDSLTDSQQNNPLHAAALSGDSPEAVDVVIILLRSGMSIDCPGALPSCFLWLDGKGVGETRYRLA